jgi:hypothetical protein
LLQTISAVHPLFFTTSNGSVADVVLTPFYYCMLDVRGTDSPSVLFLGLWGQEWPYADIIYRLPWHPSEIPKLKLKTMI